MALTPQEQAEAIRASMTQITRFGSDIIDINPFNKETALIAVDLLITISPTLPADSNYTTPLEYWQVVRQEIEKL
jgi:hypothetical protein